MKPACQIQKTAGRLLPELPVYGHSVDVLGVHDGGGKGGSGDTVAEQVSWAGSLFDDAGVAF